MVMRPSACSSARILRSMASSRLPGMAAPSVLFSRIICLRATVRNNLSRPRKIFKLPPPGRQRGFRSAGQRERTGTRSASRSGRQYRKPRGSMRIACRRKAGWRHFARVGMEGSNPVYVKVSFSCPFHFSGRSILVAMNTTLRGAAAVICILFGAGTASAAVIDLGFVLDGSGSLSSYDFDSATAALSAALSQIPTSGGNEYRVAVTSYGLSSYTIVPPTVVTAANIASIQSTVLTAYKDGGGTDTAGAITYITDLFLDDGLGDTTLINITTDGTPNSQYLTENAALAANTAGVDGISLEAVGSGVSSPYALSNMARIAGLGTSGDADAGVIAADLDSLPNATETGFVIPVADFDAYGAAIEAKIDQVIDDTGVVPLPAAMPMLLAGLGVFGFVRRRQTAG
ncbi:hypothetical protein CCR90_01525 [Rhodovulum sulfidophilum]|nr:hypothetical protein [Rhodovulum sulfidophilum]